MAYTILAIFFIALSLTIVLGAGRLLFKGRWFMGWLRGMTGLCFVVLSVVLALSAFDFFSYKQLIKEQTIASISFTKLDDQRFAVSLVDSSGNEQNFELAGDLWQLDARILKWNKTLAGLGLTPGYRLDRISGRYLALEEDRNAARTVHSLNTSKSVLDVWQWLRSSRQLLPLVDASYGSATYLPMSDGALYSVSLSGSGLLARPLNERATTAVTAWQ
ncbi:cation/multidrug efflux pump [Oceanicoccus sp. KOV_DT_Chl]|uniref:cation/multidrug efflux pump n=1 Tax=Oceanicoccus sp. KOV_DT_Chl TaxID=1904639 RepID=UPI000C7CF7E2|nr:cation/multidrug efflux pump [Oceanicoccus sp. KOV_DT_Chl]